MSADKYPSIFSRQMKAIVYITHDGLANQNSRIAFIYAMIQFLIMSNIHIIQHPVSRALFNSTRKKGLCRDRVKSLLYGIRKQASIALLDVILIFALKAGF